MDQYGGSGAYRAAVEMAAEELDQLFQEANRLRNRMEQLETVVAVLEPFLGEVEAQRHAFKSTVPEVEMVHESAYSQPTLEVVTRPVAQAKSLAVDDPIQRRIDSILGLAVA